jgi:hypothetical protein
VRPCGMGCGRMRGRGFGPRSVNEDKA